MFVALYLPHKERILTFWSDCSISSIRILTRQIESDSVNCSWIPFSVYLDIPFSSEVSSSSPVTRCNVLNSVIHPTAIMKYMPYDDPQRLKLMEADELASKVASCETDEQTKRAALMHCLERSVENFPVSYHTSLSSRQKTDSSCSPV